MMGASVSLGRRSLKKQAIGIWQLVLGQTKPPKELPSPRPSGDWDWVWAALGWPKRGPRATQASRKRHPSVDSRKLFCFQQKERNSRVGLGRAKSGHRQECLCHRSTDIVRSRENQEPTGEGNADQQQESGVNPGDESCKPFRILVDRGRGRGRGSEDRVIRKKL
jgi:hypothetical protein